MTYQEMILFTASAIKNACELLKYRVQTHHENEIFNELDAIDYHLKSLREMAKRISRGNH